MSRRRKKNPLLMRIVVAVVAAHAIALPIAAHFGAFAKIQREFGASKIVMINVPEPERQKETVKKEKKEQKKSAPVQHKKGPSEAKRSSVPAKPNPALPKVVLSNAPGGDDGGASTQQGTGQTGVIPKTVAPKTTDTGATGNGNGSGGSGATTQPKATSPAVTTPRPFTEPVKTAPVVPKKFVQVETTYAPEPTIPDDLRTDSFEKTLVVEADVDTSGKPENIKIATSSGTKELDDVGLDTAKKYRFKPATLGDDAVEGHVRFTIIFKVE